MDRTAPVELSGQRACLLPMTLAYVPALFAAGQEDEIWPYLPDHPRTLAEFQDWVQEALAEQERGASLPFVIVDRETDRIVGSTRLSDISLRHRQAEIGWTWHSPVVWRTRINTECKYLLLRHAFETLGLIRVCLKTDARNQRSQRAIERLGAVKEGILRSHRILPDGFVRDSVFYSILADEWPAVKTRLEGFLHAER